MNKKTLTVCGGDTLSHDYEAPAMEIVLVNAEFGVDVSNDSQTEDYDNGVFEW